MGDAPAIYDLGLMTYPEVEAALPDIGVLFIPVGSCEQHGPNIACASDAAQASAFARRLAARVHPRAAVAPTINYGLCEHHMHFAGTATIAPQTFIGFCVDVAAGFGRHGIGRFLFVNGHGGNKAALTTACDLLLERGYHAAHFVCGELGAIEEAPEMYQGHDVGHACEFEVSSAMYLCPELVRHEALVPGDFGPNPVRHTRTHDALIHRSHYWEERTRNGVLGDARAGASVEHGRAITERGLDMAQEFCEDFLQLPVPGHGTAPT